MAPIPMASICVENMDCITERVKEVRHIPRDFWNTAEWCSGFASKEVKAATEKSKRIFEERVVEVVEPLTHLNQSSDQEKQIRRLKIGIHLSGQWRKQTLMKEEKKPKIGLRATKQADNEQTALRDGWGYPA